MHTHNEADGLGAGDIVRKKTHQILVLMELTFSRCSTPTSQRFIFSQVGRKKKSPFSQQSQVSELNVIGPTCVM